jgi:hypothetical protein
MGVVTGGAVGGTAGGLLSMAGTDDEGLHYRQQVQSGRFLVNVATEDPEKARTALREVGALEVADLGATASARSVTEPEERGS